MSSKAVLVGDTAQSLAETLRHAGYGIIRTHLAAAGDLSPADNDIWLLAGLEARVLLGKVRKPKSKSATSEPIAMDINSQRLLELAGKVAQTDVSVLLSGESGAGKEVLARYIHNRSMRSNGPFSAINCAAIPENMLEAELFGHEKGAFTGATGVRIGRFEQAQGGTLLLDEITEMPLLLQAKLLRVLQEREIERLGGSRARAIDVRVIATTNREPREAVAQQRLREDLYYRLNVFPLRAHALRERRADIPALATHFIAKHARAGVNMSLTPTAIDSLLDHAWPGNVRELENVMQRAIVVCRDNVIDTGDILFEGEGPTKPVELRSHREVGRISDETVVRGESTGAEADRLTESLRDSMRCVESDVIFNALKENNGNRVATARVLGISERTLRHKLQKFRERGLSIPQAVKS